MRTEGRSSSLELARTVRLIKRQQTPATGAAGLGVVAAVVMVVMRVSKTLPGLFTVIHLGLPLMWLLYVTVGYLCIWTFCKPCDDEAASHKGAGKPFASVAEISS